MLDYSQLPGHIQEEIKDYIEQGVPCGGFVEAVICNDLKETCARADAVNRYEIFNIVNWFYNEAPSACWGSRTCYNHWIEQRLSDKVCPET